ncbi:hypothetical protein L7F22_035048 [Adiantum nelumboides]|nr:hypothetical protein [Adiantum nelumboides]
MSSLFTYDVYKAYLRPQATGKELLLVSRIAVVILGIGMGAFSCFIYKVNVDVNFLFLVVGLLISSSVPPLSFMLVWPAVPTNAAISGALGGQISAIIAWIVHAKIVYGELTISDTLQKLGPTMDGAIVAIVTSAIVCIIWTIVWPDTTGSYNRFKEIEVMDNVEGKPAETFKLDASIRIASIIALVLSVIMIILWPLLTLPAGVFSEAYFALWVLISMVWAVIATAICIFLPLIESRDVIMQVVKSLLSCGKGNSGNTDPS